MRGIDGGGSARRFSAVALVTALLGSVCVAGFSSESALIRPLVLDDPLSRGDSSPVWYGSALVIAASLHLLARSQVRRGRLGRAFSGWVLGVSAAVTLFFSWLAVLGTGFYAAARADIGAAETISTGILFLGALAGPSIASLAASVALVRSLPRTSLEGATDE
jgi:hypothetical protein